MQGKTPKNTETVGSLAARLRQLRVALGFTSQAKFAESLGGEWKQDHISRYETGTTAPPSDFLTAVAERHQINIQWLLTGAGHMGHMPSGVATASAPDIIPAEDFEQLRPEVRGEYVPILGATAAGPPSFETDGDQPVGWADQFVRVPGAMYGQFALRIRGQSMGPEYPDGALVLVGGPVEPRPGREALAVVFHEDSRGDAAHTVKLVSARGPDLRLRSLNPDYREQTIPMGRILRVLGVLKRLS